MGKTAHIVAIRRDSLGELGFGISGHPGDVQHIFDEGQIWVGPRPVLETDEDFVQPIPYIVLRKGDEILAYSRAGNEDRLTGKVAIGFGGHVDMADALVDHEGVIDLRRTMYAAAKRELKEEAGIDPFYLGRDAKIEWTHVIQSDAGPVDRVHIGLVCMIDVSVATSLLVFDPEIGEPAWVTLDALTDPELNLETWTGLVVGSLLAERA
jgi:predicted NUDIX family phosphoesterase